MPDPFVLPLAACRDPGLVGGKAHGLAALLRHGFSVPEGLCLTTAAYDAMLRSTGMDAERLWSRLSASTPQQRVDLVEQAAAHIESSMFPAALEAAWSSALDRLGRPPQQLWAVRSSATNEDGIARSMAGLYDSVLGVPRENLAVVIVKQWASLWRTRAVQSLLRSGRPARPPKLAIVVQPLVHARAAGVVFSCHPVTRQHERVVINAVPGLGAALAAGEVTPDEFEMRLDSPGGEWAIAIRRITSKTQTLSATARGVATVPVVGEAVAAPALSDAEAAEVARLAKQVEEAFGYPVDVEWALDDVGMWLLQARPITACSELTNEASEWSRANFKETLPELPSPMGVSFLQEYMHDNMLRRYRALGCHIPPGVAAVRVVKGRPFINVTLFQSLAAQLGSDPALVTEQMGGQGAVPGRLPKRLPFLSFARAGFLVLCNMRRALRDAPRWFEEMRHMAGTSLGEPPAGDPLHAWLQENEDMGRRLRQRDPTFAIAAGVAQGLDVLGKLLARWFPSDWRALLNASLQGQGTVISAQQILWLGDLAELARAEPAAKEFFLEESWEPGRYRAALSGTRFLREWDRFLDAHGQRGVGESDIMAPRQAEHPEAILGVVRGHLQSGVSCSSREVQMRQASARAVALTRIRSRLRRWPGVWIFFQWWYRRLCRFLALRESNRHHLMYFLVAVRRRMLAIGTHLARLGRLAAPDHIFYLTVDEVRSLAERPGRDWTTIVAARRRERAAHASMSVPDYLAVGISHVPPHEFGHSDLPHGIPISPGLVEGPVCVVRTPEDFVKIRRGMILVLPVIDPGLTAYFGLVAGVVAELGGTLSHGAIIAREYGVPAVANVTDATRVLNDGDRISLDASRGTIQRLRS